ncbi:MAG: S8 family peptidase [Luteimonas sp.]
MSMKNKTLLCAAVAAAMSMPTAFAAGPAAVIGESKIAQPSASAQLAGARLIVKYREGTLERSSTTAKTRLIQSAATRSGASAKAGRAGAISATHLRQLGVGADLLRLSQKMDSNALNALVREIAADPAVEYAQVDTRDYALVNPRRATDAQPQLTPNDPFYTQYQWNFTNATGGVNAPAAWDVANGEGIVVAVLDTGILPNHPDMNAGQLLEGYDFISDAETSRRPTDERVPGALDYGDWNPVAGECYAGSPIQDSSWHGTHVAGTVAQTTNNALGAAGLAYGAKVLPLRVLGRCGGYGADIADAIVWASGGSVPGLPANTNPAEVINLSLGGGAACDATYQNAINIATANGSLVVVAAGNSNSNVANFRPASCNNVVAVGATRITGGRASYSNFGALVDLSAPGGGGSQDPGNGGWDGFIIQAGSAAATTPDSGAFNYTGYTGTSMASPHVAAVAALVQSALSAADREPLTPAALEELLKSTARPFPTTIPANTPIGTGIVNPVAALALALEEPCDPAVEECAPPATPIVNATPVRALSGAAGGETLYSIEVPSGVSGPLSITTTGGSGDVSLHVSLGEAPAATGTWNSSRPGNAETIRINAPVAGTYYIKLTGVRAYSNVTLQARFTLPSV